MWCRLAIFALPGCIVLSEVQAAQPNLAAELRLVPEFHRTAEGSPYFLPSEFSVFPDRTSRQEVELQLGWQGLNAVSTLRNRIAAERNPDNEVILNELYWEGELLEQDLSVGKKIQSFGVGFGYRPLDVIQHENRRRLYPDMLEGVPVIVWHSFSALEAWNLIYANPGQGKDPQQERDDESFTLKYYRLQNEFDIHILLRWSERHDVELGTGFALVLNDQWEAHASLLYQHRGERFINSLVGTSGLPLASGNPMTHEAVDHPVKTLVGMSRTGEKGWTMLAETWYDGEAYDADQWQDLTALTQNQIKLLDFPSVPDSAVYANIAASSQTFARVNLLRWNTLLRISHDGERLDPSLELLYTFEDGGYVATLNTVYELERHRFRLALRAFGGPADAAFRLLPEDWFVLAAWEWTLF